MHGNLNPRLPYVVWRDDRPRFVPPGPLRKLGFKGEDLRHPGGTWFTFEEARAWSTMNLAKIVAAKGTGAKPERRAGALTVADLLEDWLASDHVKTLAANTRRNYRTAADALLFKPREVYRGHAATEREPEEMGLMPVAAIKAPELRAMFEYIKRVRGLHVAHRCVAAYSSAYKWAVESTKWRLPAHLNPRTGMTFESPPGRISVITPKEFHALVAAADRLGRPSIGDAITLGMFTGQRQSDRLGFLDDGYEDGRRKLRQAKTGTVVRLHETAELKARLDDAARRRRELMVKHGTRHKEVVLCEYKGKPWTAASYRHWFNKVRAEAAKAEPEVADKTDQDLRDTCVTLLARSGANLTTICEVTGHSYSSAALITKHYLGRDPDRADAALENMARFMKELA